jgi:DNA-binding SARP family transcriptional activator
MSDPARSSTLSAEKAERSVDRFHVSRPILAVHVLGPVFATVDGVPADVWHGGRTRSLFAYLLTHRHPWPAREMLMDLFWPGSSQEAARNSLNVAIHGLRRALRTATDRPVIVFRGNSYGLDPGIRLWLDLDEFNRHLKQARALEVAGRSEPAMREYEEADGLYRGDFLADNPYEDWPVLLREQLRLAHTDALDHLSSLCFGLRRYAATAGLCVRILQSDPCREAAHRRLMCCHSRQGQPHLALLQYRACVRALLSDLGVQPSPETERLYECIRRHEPV